MNPRRKISTVVALALGVAALLPATAGAVTAAPHWKLSVVASPTNLPPNESYGPTTYKVRATNTGGLPTDGSTITFTDTLPAGLTLNPGGFAAPFGAFFGNIDRTHTSCNPGPPATCVVGNSIVNPGEALAFDVPVNITAGSGTLTNQITVSGGGAPDATVTAQNTISADPSPLGFQNLDTWIGDAAGGAETRAGAHPYQFHFAFQLATNYNSDTFAMAPGGLPRDVHVTLPPGLVVNPQATPVLCTEAQLETASCPDASAVGKEAATVGLFATADPNAPDPVYNMVPPPGSPAELAFNGANYGFYIHLLGGVDTAGNYAITADGSDILQYGFTSGDSVELWGDPSDPSHDHARGLCGVVAGYAFGDVCPVAPSDTPFLTMPSTCSGPLQASAAVTSWEDPGNPISATAETTDDAGTPVGVTDCNALDFSPTLTARPTTNVADSPSGLSVDLHVPQNNDVNTLATSTLKKTVVTLPEGFVVNPSGANGLDGCSSSQIGLLTPVGQSSPIHFSGDHSGCPDAAKIGTVEIDTPLLANPLGGSVYIAKPKDNPFGSLLALYIVVDDPSTGVVIKLAGDVQPDPNTGRLTTTFDDNPQLPFSDFKLNFFGGANASLRTPATCGSYSSDSSMTPWSGTAPVDYSDNYSIDSSPSGGSCPTSEADQPNAPSFDAGTVTPTAGTYSPFVLNLSRNDGDQQFSQVISSPPAGLVAKLAGTPACTDAQIAQAKGRNQEGDGASELADPSCPADTQVGTVDVAAGAGPAPYNTTAKVYMGGPYKGEPLSLVIITPAVAGPFDLGVVVTQVALHIDPATVQITATADPIPSILQGIQLDVRSIRVRLDKPDFTLNGSSCDPTSLTGSLLSTQNQTASLSEPFQLAECANLGFKPRLGMRLRGGHFRNGHPAFTSVLNARAGDANIGKASVILPPSMQLDQSHIQAPCTRPQFAADQCPAASIIGSVVATSPLLDYKLSGPVYLRTGDNPLPDMVLDLHGPASQPIRIDQVGKIDTVHARLRTTFQGVPDAPISQAIIRLVGGHKGLLVNNTNLCKQPNRAAVFLDGHNNATADSHPRIALKCPKARRKHHRKSHKRHHRRHALR